MLGNGPRRRITGGEIDTVVRGAATQHGSGGLGLAFWKDTAICRVKALGAVSVV